MAAGVRRQARSYALQVLYALDLNAADANEAALSYRGAFDLDLDERSVDFATELVEKTQANLAQIDDAIQSASLNWRLERMSRVDRNILRLATYELIHSPEVPVKVVINEAVELAKQFGGAEFPVSVIGGEDGAGAHPGLHLRPFQPGDQRGGLLQRLLNLGDGRNRRP